MPNDDEVRKTKRAWLMHPTPEDEAVAEDIKRIGGHRTHADCVRVALRRYRAQLLREVRAAELDVEPRVGG